MDIRLTIDISERLENAIKAAGNLLAIVPSIERHENAGGMKIELCKAEPAKSTPAAAEDKKPDEPAKVIAAAEKPKKAAAKKSEPKPEPAPQPVEPAAAVESSTKSVEQTPAVVPAVESETTEAEDEAGKGETGQIIADLTAKLVKRIHTENRDRATLNKNLRLKCEALGLQFPTIPALIQAIGYGNAYAACIGEG